MIKQTDSTRNYGIDTLRIVSMIMILILHILKKGGVLESDATFSKKILIVFFESAAFCAVNCYGMISGFVGYGKKFKLTGIIQLWIEVVFYLTVINIIFYFISPGSVSKTQFITSFIPVSSKIYWYFTAFFALYFFKPFLNHLIETLSKKSASLLMLACIFLFTFFPSVFGGYFFKGDIFNLSFGYSLVWLICLYLFGAYIKKYGIGDKIKKRVLCISYFICAIIILAGRTLMKFISKNHPGLLKFLFPINYLTAWDYNSFFVLLSGIFLFLLFKNLNLKPAIKKITAFFAPATFGVYIIHLHPNIWNLLKDRFVFFANYNIILLPIMIIAASLGIFISCALTDKVRAALFKLLKIEVLSNKTEKILKKAINKSVDIFFKITGQSF